MEKSNKPEERGNVDWERLEKLDFKKSKPRPKEDSGYDKAAVDKEKEHLSEDEKTSPYPDEFLADWNLLQKNMGGRTFDNPSKPISKDEEE